MKRGGKGRYLAEERGKGREKVVGRKGVVGREGVSVSREEVSVGVVKGILVVQVGVEVEVERTRASQARR
jgi:hypothetical protein